MMCDETFERDGLIFERDCLTFEIYGLIHIVTRN